MVATQALLCTATAVAMVHAASLVDGAGRRLCEDEHDDPNCGLSKGKEISEEIQCAFVVTHTQLRVVKPNIQDSNVGAICKYLEHGRVHDRLCKKCGIEHNPCNNTFTSCRGCCTSPHRNVPLREQSCQLIKGYLSREEARQACELRTRKDGEPWTEPSITEEVVDATVVHSKIIQDECSLTLNQLDCPKVPVRVDFECNQCNKGSPLLLKTCCDECVKFAKSSKLANLTTILPFVVCNGCDTKVIFTPSHDKRKAATETDPATKYWKSWVADGGKTMPWFAAGGYQNYSATVAQADMESWIETNICKVFEPETCGADHEYPRDRRLLHSPAGLNQTNFNFSQCRRQQELQASTTTSSTTTSLKITSMQNNLGQNNSSSSLGQSNTTQQKVNDTGSDSSSSCAMSVTTILMVVAGLVV